MKYVILILFIGFVYLGYGQEPLLLEIKTIDNLEETPIFPRLIKSDNGVPIWKDKNRYIDRFEMNWITYKSDGLKVNGLLVVY